MPSFKEVFDTAIAKGYRIDGRGRVVSPRGVVRKLRIRSHSGTDYAYVTLAAGGTVISVPVHRFGAYIKFGNRIFDRGVHVRHRNGKSLDNRLRNFILGCQSENEHDKPRHVRVRSARNAAQARWKKRTKGDS